jgi:hypothetical protein
MSLVEGVGNVMGELLKLEPAVTAAQLLKVPAPK